MKLPKYQQVAATVRDQIADGVLMPGASAPSGATLARETGYSVLTCRRALQALVKDGVLVPGASRNARPRVPSVAQCDQTLDHAKRELSARLAGFRRAAGLTQPQLAEMTGYSVTTIGHAETGRVWQSRPFWELADEALNADGELLLLHDTYRAAQVPADPATVPEEIELGTAAAAEPPTPVMILIVWTDGEITEVPMSRAAR